jgi:tRNA-Thr(GGU) m(6)t(6)A37 methyltransferase TsaA
MQSITMHPIGIIHSPYASADKVPIQAQMAKDVEATIELYDKYQDGLKDLEGFSHAIILYYFHQSNREDIISSPFLESTKHGIFAIRSPHRPNHIGMSVVKIKHITGNQLVFSHVDMLDGTPVLDIKPYIPYADSRKHCRLGWLEKHMIDGKMRSIHD